MANIIFERHARQSTLIHDISVPREGEHVFLYGEYYVVIKNGVCHFPHGNSTYPEVKGPFVRISLCLKSLYHN